MTGSGHVWVPPSSGRAPGTAAFIWGIAFPIGPADAPFRARDLKITHKRGGV